jgi:AcrR family transcriptional regulator
MSDASVRMPKQTRSRESLERVLGASRSLLEEKGLHGLTIQDVSQRAEVSVGAIYARFGSKESLLRAVHSHAIEWLRAEHEAAFAAAGTPGQRAGDAIPAAVQAIAHIFRRNEDLLRAFMHLGAVDEQIARRGVEGIADLARQFKAAVLAHRDKITHPDPETGVDLAFRIAFSTFARRVMRGPAFDSDRPIDWDQLVEEVGTACAAYLLQERAPSRPEARAGSPGERRAGIRPRPPPR